jgi:hypothetical protein
MESRQGACSRNQRSAAFTDYGEPRSRGEKREGEAKDQSLFVAGINDLEGEGG